MKKILVIGAGAWGTSIAELLAQNSHQVFLGVNNAEIAAKINQNSSNKRFLPEISLHKNIAAILDYSNLVASCDFIFIAVPSAACAELFSQLSGLKISQNCGFVICSKGFESDSLELLSDSFEKKVKTSKYAVLSGPNFALEVAKKAPTITTIASFDEVFARQVIAVLSNEYFVAQYFADPRTAEVCGIVKNIIAIGCGICDGLNLGVNAKAAMVLKGVQEIQALCTKINASSQVDHAGFGDIFLTCSSSKSRNNSLGALLTQEKSYEEILRETNKTYEGAFSAKAVCEVAKKLKLQLDLCEAINQILSRKHAPDQIRSIISKSILK